MTKLAPSCSKLNFSSLRDINCSQLLNLEISMWPIKNQSHSSFVCLFVALPCFVFFAALYYRYKLGSGRSRMPSPPFFFILFFCSLERPTSNGPDAWLLIVELPLMELENFRKITSSFGVISVPLMNWRVAPLDPIPVNMPLISLLNPYP